MLQKQLNKQTDHKELLNMVAVIDINDLEI